MLLIKELSKSYHGVRALDQVSLEIGPGEIIGLFGANGAGKTSLLKAILNLIRFDGSITLNGERITRKNLERFSFASAEHSFFANLSAEEHRDFFKAHFAGFREKRFQNLMDFFKLPRDKKIKNFSLGQQNQFELILALTQGADYILMDEPFAGNDIFNREDFYKLLLGILEEHETVLLATHLIEEVANFVDRVLILDRGRLLCDVSMAEIESRNLSLVKYLKEQLNYEADRVSRMIEDFE